MVFAAPTVEPRKEIPWAARHARVRKCIAFEYGRASGDAAWTSEVDATQKAAAQLLQMPASTLSDQLSPQH